MAVNHKAYLLPFRTRARQLAVTPAPDWAFLNVPYTPRAGVTYIQEDYVPAVAPQVTLGLPGSGAELEATGFYVLRVFSPTGGGFDDIYKYAQGLLDLFKPGYVLVATNGDVIRVRSNPIAPYAEALRNMEGGRAMVPVNVPFRVMTANTT